MEALSAAQVSSAIPRLVAAFVTCHFCELSGAAFVSLKWIESAAPPVGEVEDRHVEHKHRIVPSPVAPEHFSPRARQAALPSFHSCLSRPKESSTIHFIS